MWRQLSEAPVLQETAGSWSRQMWTQAHHKGWMEGQWSGAECWGAARGRLRLEP